MTPETTPRPLPADAPPESFSSRDALLSWIQEIAPYGIFTTDAALRVRSWNQWLVAHSGLSPEQVLGQSLLELFPELETRRLHERYQRALTGEISVLSSALHRYLLPFVSTSQSCDTAHMLQTARIAPLPFGNVVVGTITIVEDVTERECQALALQRRQDRDRLLSQALARLLQSDNPMRDMAELLPTIAPSLGIDAFFSHRLDPDSRVLRMTTSGGIPPAQKEALARLELGKPGRNCLAKTQQTILSSLQTEHTPEFEPLRSAGWRLYCCFPLAVGDRLFGTLSVGSYSRDSLPADDIKFFSTLAQYVGIAMERTSREAELREAQLSLSKHAESLETKVNERTARLHDTISQLESFSYTIAHDLREPIRALKGYAELLLMDYSRLLPEEGQFIIRRLERASERLDVLTRDLLHFSKITQQDVQLAPVDLTEVVQDLASASPALARALTIQQPLGVVRGQRTLLQQCFSNLFDNALKFSTPGAPLRIVVRAEATQTHSPDSTVPFPAFSPSTHPPLHTPTAQHIAEGGAARHKPGQWIKTWIEDNGIGIAPQAHRKIFGIFERATGAENIEGTGIGLAIVARAMQRMGGNCGVESDLGKGSRFWLELPLAAHPTT